MSNWLFVTPFYKPAHVYGGPTYSISTLCENLVELGCSVNVFTTNANGNNNLSIPAGEVQNINRVKVYYFKRDLRGNYFYSNQLTVACNKMIHPSNFDIVYIASNWGYPLIPSCLASIKSKTSYIISPRASFKRNAWHGKFLKKFIYHLFVERILINKASLIHYTTKIEATQSSWLNLKPRKIIIPNPVNIQKNNSLPVKGCFRTKYLIDTDKKILLVLGRIDPDKGLDLAIQSLSKVLQKFPNVLLVIAGPEENNYIKVLNKISEGLGVSDHIMYTGLLNSTQRIEALVDADILISPSRSENFGMSVVEAMACKTPVIVSDQVGIADDILKGNAGLVVPLNPSRMAEAIINLLSQPIICKELSTNAVQVVQSNYDPNTVAIKFQQVLSQLKS